ncbi:MAG TPA: PIG-L family deacetylase [Candidatus Sulfotelmatobacter sp.]|nr:PIG-L family deacetylase [Candidatus Sulfotelmatobacter sp.]
MRNLVMLVLLATASVSAQTSRTILAVFAHPDDETVAGPVLARYAREGNKVYLAIATKGEKGANERAGIPAGDALAKARSEEAACACRQLGIEPPVLLGLNDGEMGAISNPLGRNIQEVADRVAKLISELHPSAVITWGADGGYGHPDHRLVGDAVTQVMQASKSDAKFYYVGFSPGQTELVDKIWPMKWHPTDPAYLTVRVSFSKADLAASRRALECHKSQFSPEEVKKLEEALDNGWQQAILFRPGFSGQSSEDLLK